MKYGKMFWKRTRRIGFRRDLNESNLGFGNLEKIRRTKIYAGNEKKGNWYVIRTLKQSELKREFERKGFQWFWDKLKITGLEIVNESNSTSKKRQWDKVLWRKTKSKNLRSRQARIWISK